MTVNQADEHPRRRGLPGASRGWLTVIATVTVSLLLSGCTGFSVGPQVTPWVVANHDAKLSYHQNAADALMRPDTAAKLAELEQFQAVGYQHVVSGSNASHLEYTTSVDGETYVSVLTTNAASRTLAQSHRGGDPTTLYPLNDTVQQQLSTEKSWVSAPLGDLQLRQHPEQACRLLAVSYTCLLITAWHLTREQHDSIPVALSRTENGSQHVSTAVSYRALEAAGLLSQRVTTGMDQATLDELIPLHLWLDETGMLTKMEANGVTKSTDGQEVALQIGFEVTANLADSDMIPTDPATVPADDTLVLETQEQAEQFLTQLTQAQEAL